MNTEKFTEMALTEMFKRVGRTYTRRIVSTPDWFLETTWTADQEADFQTWLAGKFRSRGYRKSKAINYAGMFILFYGWTVQDKNK